MGFDVSLAAIQVDDQLLCGICRNILEDPVGTTCGHSFCTSCIWSMERALIRTKCPSCDSVLKDDSIKKVSNAVLLKLALVYLKCPKQCGSVVSVKNLTKHHYDVCNNVTISCENASLGCRRKFLRGNLDIHRLSCLYENTVCDVCGEKFLRIHAERHEAKKKCHEKTFKLMWTRSFRKCNKDVIAHLTQLRQESLQIEHDNRILYKQSLAGRGLRGFSKFSPESEDNVISDEIVNQMDNIASTECCVRCGKLFSEVARNKTTCRWHSGPMVETFGGMCLACGKPNHMIGCKTGHHKAWDGEQDI